MKLASGTLPLSYQWWFNGADVGQRIGALGANGFNIPSLLSVGSTGPYLHSGAAQTLDEVLNGAADGNGLLL